VKDETLKDKKRTNVHGKKGGRGKPKAQALISEYISHYWGKNRIVAQPVIGNIITMEEVNREETTFQFGGPGKDYNW